MRDPSDPPPHAVERPDPGAAPDATVPTARRVPLVIAVGGGRGGAGKSLLAVNLAVYLAQLGRSVVVADADPAGSDLHALLGLDAPPPADDDAGEAAAVEPAPTPVPGLLLCPAAYDARDPSPMRPGRRGRFQARLRQLPADYVLVDLGAGVAQPTLDLFLGADVGVCVTVPEPPAIEATYRFVRALFVRRLRRSLVKERFKLGLFERALAAVKGPLPVLPAPLEVVEGIARFDAHLAEMARAELARLRPRLVVNQTRMRNDVELGVAMRAVAARYLGVDFDYLGHIESDDAVWLTVRRRQPLLIDSPTSKAARNVERIARRALAVLAARDARVPDDSAPLRGAPRSLYDVLGVSRGASDEEVRRAYKRQRDLYAPGSLALTSLLREGELGAEQLRIQEAYDTLLDPVRRRAYDLSVFPEAASDEPARGAPADATEAELMLLQAELAREIHAETEFTGALLRKVREAQGVGIDEIAARTKIAAAHLRALEEEAFTDLPAMVYTRGFVQELAKFLRLDASQVTRTYLKRMREALGAAGRPAE